MGYAAPMFWLQGCGAVPEVVLVEPTEVLAGETVRVVGQRLGAVGLRLGSVALRTEDRGPTSVLGRVPDSAPPGHFRLDVLDRSGAHPTELSVTVISDRPCAAEFRSNTKLSVARQAVVLDRFWPDGRRQRWTLEGADLARIEVESTPGCSAIFLRRKAGGRLLYDDDATEDLVERAYTVAEMLNLPVLVAAAP